jgi:uncharacterized protein with ATP-grasp and redox domains
MKNYKDINRFLADSDDDELAMAAIAEIKSAARTLVDALRQGIGDYGDLRRALTFVANAVDYGIQGALTKTETALDGGKKE